MYKKKQEIMLYKLFEMTPLNKLNKRDNILVESAVEGAKKSAFKSSIRLGACLEKEQCILCGGESA